LLQLRRESLVDRGVAVTLTDEEEEKEKKKNKIPIRHSTGVHVL
jgi:hypothetical protein